MPEFHHLAFGQRHKASPTSIGGSLAGLLSGSSSDQGQFRRRLDVGRQIEEQAANYDQGNPTERNVYFFFLASGLVTLANAAWV